MYNTTDMNFVPMQYNNTNTYNNNNFNNYIFQTQNNFRKHLTTACVACKQRKKKCSGDTPSCNFCISKNQPCVYDSQDKRGPKTKKVKIENNNNNTIIINNNNNNKNNNNSLVNNHGPLKPRMN